MKTNLTIVVRMVLCVTVGLALVGTGPASAAELAPTEGGHEASCDVLYSEAFEAIDELGAILPVDSIREPEMLGRIMLVTRQLDHDLFWQGC